MLPEKKKKNSPLRKNSLQRRSVSGGVWSVNGEPCFCGLGMGKQGGLVYDIVLTVSRKIDNNSGLDEFTTVLKTSQYEEKQNDGYG